MHSKGHVAGPSHDQSQPKIYKLNIDCFDEIFEYLSLHDLHSVGKTCKTMQKVAGEYFAQNFSTAATRFENYGPHTNVEGTSEFALTTGFNSHIKHIVLDSVDFGYNYISTNILEFKSINEINFIYAMLYDIIDGIQEIFSQLEIVRIKLSFFLIEIYEKMLKFCVNLKRLHLNISDIQYAPLFRQTYPKLVHLELNPIESIYDLIAFFQKNPQLKNFSTDSDSFEKYEN